jgi:hypothetical protein
MMSFTSGSPKGFSTPEIDVIATFPVMYATGEK